MRQGHRSHVAEREAPTSDAVIVFFPCVETSRVAVTQARSRLRRALGRKTREAAALRQAAEIAATASPMVDPLQQILEVALAVLPGDQLVLLHASADRMESVIVAAAGTAHTWRWLRAPLRPGIAARAIQSGEAQMISETVGYRDGSTGQLMGSVLVVPVILRGGVFGVLETADEQRRLTRQHVTLLRAFAVQCAIVIDDARGGIGEITPNRTERTES
jgi:GAF domain-containing protein